MAGAVFKMLRSGCSSGMSQLMGCMNIIQSLVTAPMKGIVQAVVGGVWIGDGATAFVDEVSNLAMPGVGMVSDHVQFMRNNIQKAMDTINQAENQAKGIAQNLGDIFGGIYSG